MGLFTKFTCDICGTAFRLGGHGFKDENRNYHPVCGTCVEKAKQRYRGMHSYDAGFHPVDVYEPVQTISFEKCCQTVKEYDLQVEETRKKYQSYSSVFEIQAKSSVETPGKGEKPHLYLAGSVAAGQFAAGDRVTVIHNAEEFETEILSAGSMKDKKIAAHGADRPHICLDLDLRDSIHIGDLVVVRK